MFESCAVTVLGLLDVGECFPGDWVVVDTLSFGAGSEGAGLAELDGWYVVTGNRGP